ncbi:MAG: type II toxin-antitoxin system VapC family toxin [Acetobacteraceae bacterium]|nr:type II toxin-antitoxin system VapC family toxin [Acetobacteraceae bacterium]
MRLLLDTHALIWAVSEPRRLPAAWHAAITALDATVFVSAVTAWEIAIKRALGRVNFPLEKLDATLEEAGFEHLPILAEHGIAAGGLPRHHGDPFDRMLVAQARLEGLTLVSDDAAIAAYDVRLLATH